MPANPAATSPATIPVPVTDMVELQLEHLAQAAGCDVPTLAAVLLAREVAATPAKTTPPAQ